MKTKKNGTAQMEPTNNQSNDGSTPAQPGAALALTVGHPPPAQRAPAPPSDWQYRKLGRVGALVTAVMADNAGQAASELSKTGTYLDDFGPRAPKPEALTKALLGAASWRDHCVVALRWLRYASEQRAVWEKAMLKELAELQPLFDYASARDPDIAKRYPSLKQVVGARRAISLRSAKAKKKEGKGTQAAPPPGDAAPKAPPAPPSPPSQEPPAPEMH